MIPFEQAFEIIISRVKRLPTEHVPLSRACGRILAQEVVCDVDMPPFDKSAMDGYACRREDLPGPLRIIEVIQAGTSPAKSVHAGECAKIMTGAMLPKGADCVVMVEHTELDGTSMMRHTRPDTAENICRQGEDVRAGDLVLRQGMRLAPQHIAMLASSGCAHPLVSCVPQVGVLATGDELVEPETVPGPAQIRNSNSYQICAQLEQTGARVTNYGGASDTRTALDAAIRHALSENEVLVLSGGVSMGDFDLVPQAMAANGLEILFDAVAMKPGKPSTFGIGPSGYCFALPGNPVSTFVQCEILIKPFLFAIMGHSYQAPCAFVPLAETIRQRQSERDRWLPAFITEEGTARIVTYHGSAHINALGAAHGLIMVPRGATEIPQGTPVRVRLI